MVQYRILKAVTATQEYIVEADSQAEAVHLVYSDTVNPVSIEIGGLDYTRGLDLSVIDRDLMLEILEHGYIYTEGILEGITLIEEVEEK
jgi:Pyruvate/2-oxoacid:ferredoxin oxidoreductase gamma subunit